MRKNEAIMHDEFNIKMQQARLLYVKQNYNVPELDMEKLEHVYKTSRKRNSRHVMRMAAMLAIVLLCGMSIGVWISGDGAYGGQNIINKCLNVIAPENSEILISDDMDISEVAIEDESLVDTELNKLADAHKPGYVPEGYTFEQMKVQDIDDLDETFIQYCYKKGEIPLFISFYYYRYENQDITVVGKLYKSPVTGQNMYIDEIEDTGEYTVIAVFDSYDCHVTGIGSVEEGIKVMENIYQYR